MSDRCERLGFVSTLLSHNGAFIYLLAEQLDSLLDMLCIINEGRTAPLPTQWYIIPLKGTKTALLPAG